MFEDLEDDFMDDDFSDDFDDDGGAMEEEGGNNFALIAGVVGGIILLGIICTVIYAVFIRGGGQGAARADVEATNAAAYVQQTEVAIWSAQTAEADAWTNTPTVTVVPTDTPEPTATEVIVATDTPEVALDPTDDPRTATVAALLTLAAEQSATEVTGTPLITPIVTLTGTEELPNAGFMDDVGLPGLLLLTFFTLIVLFLARRMRASRI